ncbi:MAG: hypothetical protein EXS02_03115 [Planctomycetes bacterium]|nr:hypothetical protein [Planctomycetota bacterium]
MATAHAGPLCRFYAQSPEQARLLVFGIEAWRRELSSSLAGRLPKALDWREDPDQAAHTFQLGDAGFMALQLFAFYCERSEFELPDTVPALLELDREFRSALEAKFANSRYGHLLACSVWLPLDFHITMRAPLPDGENAEIGSLEVLHDQLRWLNQRTFQADESEIATWRTLPAKAGGELIKAAQRGFAGLSQAVALGRAGGFPVVVREV